MRLNRLVLNDFVSHEETDLDLSGVQQEVVTGAVGAGKSSLIDAITWVLWGECRYSVMDSVVRDGADACSVRLEFTVDSHAVSVTRTKARGRDSTLALVVDGVARTKHTLRETALDIVTLVGLPYSAALAGPLMLQEAAALMRLRPAERKEVLLGLFGLERFIAWEDAAKEKRDYATMTVRSHESALALGDAGAALLIVEQSLAAITPRIETLHEAVAFGRDRVSELTERTAGLRARTSRATQLNLQLTDARTQFSTTKLLYDASRKELAEAVAKANSVVVLEPVTPQKVQEAEEAYRAASKVHAERYGALADLRGHVRAAETAQRATCPKCGEVFRPGVSDEDLRLMTEDLNEAMALESQAAQAKAKAEATMRLLRDDEQKALALRSQKAAAEADVTRLREKIDGAMQLLDQLGVQGKALRAELESLEEVGPELTSALDELASARGALDNNESDLRAAEAQAVRWGADAERLRRDKQRHDEMRVELEAARKDALTYGTLAKAFHRDGIPTLMLESGLPLIEQRANEVLSRMPGEFSVRLTTQRLTSGQKVQERLDVVVEIGGREREYEGLSGGQKFRVDLALRLGLTKALAGRSFESLIIDEGLDQFQDAAGREALLESLATVSQDFGLVFVVSHHPEVIERFGNRIEVTMEEGVSVAQLV